MLLGVFLSYPSCFLYEFPFTLAIGLKKIRFIPHHFTHDAHFILILAFLTLSSSSTSSIYYFYPIHRSTISHSYFSFHYLPYLSHPILFLCLHSIPLSHPPFSLQSSHNPLSPNSVVSDRSGGEEQRPSLLPEPTNTGRQT